MLILSNNIYAYSMHIVLAEKPQTKPSLAKDRMFHNHNNMHTFKFCLIYIYFRIRITDLEMTKRFLLQEIKP